jgi:hypothetical protein
MGAARESNYISRPEVMRLPKVPSKSRNISGNSIICDITKFCTNRQMSLIINMAVHVRKCKGIKGNNVGKSVRHHSSDLYLKAMVIKHAEQTNACEVARI